jgi:acyl dehydratase
MMLTRLVGQRSMIRVAFSTTARRLISTRLNGEVTVKQRTIQTASSPHLLKGIVLDHAVDLRSARPGDRLDIPYELTVSETLQDFWAAAFFDNSRITTSTPFARRIGLQDRALPFSLALFLTSSMSHADAAKVQVGFGKVSYLWPIFAGDTLSKSFTVNAVRNTSDGNHSVIHFTCDLINQRKRLCMRADKRMLFQFPVPDSSATNSLHEEIADTHVFRDHLLSQANVLAKQPSHSLAKLQAGQLILHSLHRSLTFTQSQQLASLARLTHPRHFDTRRYDRFSEILIPGGLVLGITMSASARDLHEILHEEIQSCSYANPLHPENMVGAISYVSHVDDTLAGDLELVTVTTIGVKNINVQHDLADTPIPLELFTPGIFSKHMEQICKESCLELSNKIVVQVTRKILRQANHRQVFLL